MQYKHLKKSSITAHHNVPTSLGGTSHPVNISKISRKRHEDFHAWAGNIPPCQIIRSMILHGIGTDDPPHPSTVENIFRITCTLNSTKLYVRDAFRSIAEPYALTYAYKSARFTSVQILSELLSARETYHAITNGGSFPIHSSEFLSKAQEYFTVNTANEAAISFCTDIGQDDEFAWVKPMRLDVHNKIMEALEEKHRPRTKKREKKEFSDIMRSHVIFLEKSYDQWKKILIDFSNSTK